MRLEDYFDFLGPEDIRIRGTRVGIEFVVLAHLQGASPEEIQRRLPSTTLEQVYATITYYFANQEQVRRYVDEYLAFCERAERAFDENPPPHVRRLVALKERMSAGEPAGVA